MEEQKGLGSKNGRRKERGELKQISLMFGKKNVVKLNYILHMKFIINGFHCTLRNFIKSYDGEILKLDL